MNLLQLRNSGFAGCHLIGTMSRPDGQTDIDLFDIGDPLMFGISSAHSGAQVFNFTKAHHYARGMIEHYIKAKAEGTIRKVLKRRGEVPEVSRRVFTKNRPSTERRKLSRRH